VKKLLAAASLGLLLAGGTVVGASAAPGPNGHNNHGLCTALFNGSDQGRSHKQDAGPFATLIQNAPDGSDQDNSGGSLQDAWDWCQQFGVGGNPTPPSQ
jgi:hypothetical protein